ncbi:ribosome maturation factor RimM [Mucilaginibacter sp. SMC90]|uniref:ribosome maturation factor RimM n=2 Tax=unclassified Mucilaginibacter TaxID=2617802 RepID=UPI001FB5655F|nr:ribosome maturation factor RimM [Mucilaginibacter sp. SMC90]UOE49638.1 ribosome maturation factor RimM [Mucilaginibacter sp. SMC90]
MAKQTASPLLFNSFYMKAEDHFRIGTVLKTKGLKGELQIYVDFDGIEDIKFNALFIDIAGKMIPYFVSSIKYLQKNNAYLNLEDVDTIEKASALVKRDIYLPGKLKPKKKKNEFTLNDVEGFIAIDETHGELGEILSVQEYPQQLIATVQYKNKEVLFPLNLEIIKGIDVEGGEIYIDLPEGLLDIYLEG